MLPRLKPACFYDLVIEIAIVRLEPIQGDMVHPYLRRKAGLEAINYPNEAINSVLSRTLGVLYFRSRLSASPWLPPGLPEEKPTPSTSH